MRATRVYFERTKSEPGYCNRKAGIEIEISGTERAADALRNAEIFVAHALNESPSPQQMEVALEFVNRGKRSRSYRFDGLHREERRRTATNTTKGCH